MKSILLVEDNPDDVELTMRAFARRKLANPVIVARDGEEALSWILRWESGEEQPLVMQLDLKLPKIGGLEVLQEVRTRPISRLLPVVVLTTSDSDAEIRRAYELGANFYIVKPVEFEKFMSIAAQIELYWCAINRLPD